MLVVSLWDVLIIFKRVKLQCGHTKCQANVFGFSVCGSVKALLKEGLKGALRRGLKGGLRRGFKGGLRRGDLEFSKGASRVFQAFEGDFKGGLRRGFKGI